MKILHLVHNYYPSIGGSQHMIQKFSENLSENFNDELVVFTTNGMYSPHDSRRAFLPQGVENINGVEVHRYKFMRAFSVVYRKFRRLSSFLGIKRLDSPLLTLLNTGPISYGLAMAIKKAQVDIICSTPAAHLQTFYPLLLRRSRSDPPVVIYGALHLNNSDISKYSLWAIRKCDAYIAHTNFELKYLVERGVPQSKIHLIGAGVEIEKFEAADGSGVRQRFGIGSAPLVAFIGRQAPYKGLDILVEAMEAVWGVHPNVFLLIAGEPTSYTKHLKARLQELAEERQKRIIHLDFLEAEDLPNYYKAADIFVSVSTQESFGITYVEAWATGTPVIGARIGALESLVDEGQDGYLVDHTHKEELVNRLMELLDNPEKRQRMGKNGYARVKKQYSWDAVSAKLRDVYLQLIQ